MRKRGLEEKLCEDIQRLSVAQGYPCEDPDRPKPQKPSCTERLGRLEWYDKLLLEAPECESNCLNWKAWANCGACLYHLGEKKASWDAYAQAAHALQGFRTQLSDAALLSDPSVGKFIRTLDREFRDGAWDSIEADELALFMTLVQHHRAGEICTQRWHERDIATVFRERLSKPERPMQEICPDDSRMELCSGNSVALLAAPERLFASSDAKRARLHEHVLDVCVECKLITAVADDPEDFCLTEVCEPSHDEVQPEQKIESW